MTGPDAPGRRGRPGTRPEDPGPGAFADVDDPAARAERADRPAESRATPDGGADDAGTSGEESGGESHGIEESEMSGEVAAASWLTRLRRILGGIPRFGQLLFRLLGDPRVSLLDKAIFGTTLVYLFVPFDLVPDWMPVMGQMDDLLLVVFAMDRLLYRTDRELLLEHWSGDPASLEAMRDLIDRAAEVLPGWARGLLRAG